ncbi:MAG: SAM-dependent methyltransferase, partial [Leifsonia sp.]
RVIATEAGRYPSLTRVAAGLGGSVTVSSVPIPLDCTDGFGEAYYGRPEAFLDPGARRANSAWSFVDAGTVDGYVAALAADLESGEWDRRFGALRSQAEFDGSLRLIAG